MRTNQTAAAPIKFGVASSVETLADDIDVIAQRAKAEYDPRDETQRELVEALSVAWLAAERWRIERCQIRMASIDQH
jgi:hypothetical protein